MSCGQLLRRALHGMAQADGADLRRHARQRGAVDRHRIDVLQHQRVRAELLHVARDVDQHRRCAEAAHDAADAERVGDRLAQAVLLRHLEIGNGAGLVAGDLDHQHDVVGILQRAAAVGGGGDFRLRIDGGRDALRDDVRRREPLRVDVHQRDLAVLEQRLGQDVADEVFHEHRRAGADHGDLGHCRSTFLLRGFKLNRNASHASTSSAALTSRLV